MLLWRTTFCLKNLYSTSYSPNPKHPHCLMKLGIQRNHWKTNRRHKYENNEIFSIIRIGTYKQYEKSIAGVDIDCFNEYKQNLLQEAIAACKNDIAKDLINRNIDLNHQDSNGQAPLHYCAQYLNIEIARLLLSKNADINIEDAYGNNPLWTAVFNARGDYRMVELFIEYNANIHHWIK